MNLHYGCGMATAPGWTNYDASPTLWLQRLPVAGAVFRRFLTPVFPPEALFGNIVAGLSIPEDSCAAVYCCHVLEHLGLKDARRALQNTNRYLVPGGLFRIVVPDFEQLVANYLKQEEPDALSKFLTYTHLGRPEKPRGVAMILREFLGNSHHLWMWDFKGLAQELELAGFNNVRRCEFGDSADPVFQSVEHRGRFEGALAIECSK